jgi:hypothetical protein
VQEELRAMKLLLLQSIVLISAIAGIAGIKRMALQAWITFPPLAILLVLAISDIVGATYFDRKTSDKQAADPV